MPAAAAACLAPDADSAPRPIEPTDDATLVRAIRTGDRVAFASLHRRYGPFVHGVLMTRVPPHDADDLVQEVFLTAFRKLRTLRDADAIGPWLATIARHAAARLHRRRRPTTALPSELEAPAARGDDGDHAARAQEILAAIHDLPEAYRETLVLRLVEGLSGPQIAHCTGLTAGSVRVNLHRGMQLLRTALGTAGGKEVRS